MKKTTEPRVAMKRLSIITALLLFSSGCVVVGGYSSGRGWFIWPGTFVILLIAAVLFLFFRRR
jgi:hypothetical protein